jgi:hypothetical protein
MIAICSSQLSLLLFVNKSFLEANVVPKCPGFHNIEHVLPFVAHVFSIRMHEVVRRFFLGQNMQAQNQRMKSAERS